MKSEVPIFYISSKGSTATNWLAKMLSRHPQVVCFRSTRSFPPYATNAIHPESSVDSFMEGLLECSKAVYGEKIFGSVHRYHGIAAKEPCEKRGGVFSYMTRHPVSRIHSVYISYLEGEYYKRFGIPIANKDIHDKVCSELLADVDLLNIAQEFEPEAEQNSHCGPGDLIKGLAKKVLPDFVIKSLAKQKNRFLKKGRHVSILRTDVSSGAPDESLFAGIQFIFLVNDYFRFDYEILKGCPIEIGIKMEEMVKSPEYFKNHVLRQIAPELEVTEPYLKSIFSEPRIHVHRDKVLSPVEIWESWPTGIKEVFMKYFEYYNMSEICKAFDYEVSFL